MTEVLRLSDSCYLPAFLSLRSVLAKEAAISEENLKVLALLIEPCKVLESAQPKVCSFSPVTPVPVQQLGLHHLHALVYPYRLLNLNCTFELCTAMVRGRR